MEKRHRPLEDGWEKIQCVEISGNKDTKLLLISIYLPAKGSNNHVTEFQECIDELYEPDRVEVRSVLQYCVNDFFVWIGTEVMQEIVYFWAFFSQCVCKCFGYKAYKIESKNVQKTEGKIKWEKVDKDLYMAMVQTNTDNWVKK
jgi:hypothetical protein